MYKQYAKFKIEYNERGLFGDVKFSCKICFTYTRAISCRIISLTNFVQQTIQLISESNVLFPFVTKTSCDTEPHKCHDVTFSKLHAYTDRIFPVTCCYAKIIYAHWRKINDRISVIYVC